MSEAKSRRAIRINITELQGNCTHLFGVAFYPQRISLLFGKFGIMLGWDIKITDVITQTSGVGASQP